MNLTKILGTSAAIALMGCGFGGLVYNNDVFNHAIIKYRASSNAVEEFYLTEQNMSQGSSMKYREQMRRKQTELRAKTPAEFRDLDLELNRIRTHNNGYALIIVGGLLTGLTFIANSTTSTPKGADSIY